MSRPEVTVSDSSAMNAIANCFSQSGNRVLTELESHLWVMALDKHGAKVIFNFAAYWASGSAQRGYSTTPPTISDLDAFINPSDFDAQVALNHLRDLVRRVGHMQNPGESADNPPSDRMLHAIDLLGGWVKLCASMPIEGSVEWAVFAKNFEACWRASEAKCKSGLVAPPALGLVSLQSETQQLLLSRTYVLADSDAASIVPTN